MFHNYLVATGNNTTTISIDVGTEVSPSSDQFPNGCVNYYGTKPVYINGNLHIREAKQFKITKTAIIVQWTSENL